MLVAKNTTLVLQQLRLLMRLYFEIGQNGQQLDALIVPTSDAHHNIRIADCDQRRRFISGFDGSAGTAVVTQTQALLWTDGRYFILAEEQLDENWTIMKEGMENVPTQEEWLIQNLGVNATVGVDAKQYSKAEWDNMFLALKEGGQTLVPVVNLVDQIWIDRPNCPNNPVIELGIEFSGKSSSEKIQNVRKVLSSSTAKVLLISELDEIAWLLNLRGSDLPLAPVFFSYVILTPSSLDIFVNQNSLNDDIIANLKNSTENVTFYEYDLVYEILANIVDKTDGKIWLSKNGNSALASLVPEDRLIVKLTPIAVMKSIKNPTEAQGMRNCFIRDAAAVSTFYAWLEKTMQNGENLTEISAADKLFEFRSKAKNFVSLSFKTISGSGPNGAIVHYWPTNETDRKLSVDEMYLVDSGAHYLDGTTDLTRTFYFGNNISDHMKNCYTRVLKGQFSLATLTFPKGVTGHTIDAFARRALWENGLDFQHGTGHGIGHYLNVGEGPQSINYNHNPDDPGLQENMFLSNEPGYYEEGNFGIRLENAIRISKSKSFDHFLEMEDLTFVPYQQSLINVDLLTENEVNYLNTYNRKCRESTGTYLLENPLYDDSGLTLAWLEKETQPISYYSKG